MSDLRSIAIAGATGTLGKHVLKALLLPELRSRFSQIIVLKRNLNPETTDTDSQNHDFIVRTYDQGDLVASLEGVDVLVNAIGASGHEFKEKLLRAIPDSKVKLYIPSEFGVDHDIHDFAHAEWDQKKHHVEVAKSVLTTATRMCRVFIGLFTEESIGPWFGFDTAQARYEIIGSASRLVTYTALDDVGKVVASLTSLPMTDIPETIHIAGDTINTENLARTMEHAGSKKIEIVELDLPTMKAKTIAQKTSDPSQYLRFLMAEGKINHSNGGLGNDNELVNPGEKFWKWKKMKDYAEETKGTPWVDFKWNVDGLK